MSPEFSVVILKNKYYLITQDNGYLTCGLGRDIFSYESSSPFGKFVTQRKLFTIEDQINGHYLLTYNAMAHPQFNMNDELLISYNVNDLVDTLEPNVCPSQCKHVFSDRMNADSYRPKFVRVPFETLGIKSANHLGGVELNPNPAVSVLLGHVHAGGAQFCNISIINKMGEVMLEKNNIALTEGDNQIQLDISSLKPDIYFFITQPGGATSADQVWEKKVFVKE